ncbi:hypothetical protein BD310DRAFT_1010823 [Dichomitus squalens]|uniref:3-oxo-5-alpha-steroid 4-dehydrogenase C-terminal domain-containing protein n=1 Tax=Dichomitus squalens TaxID=114155 RepID=A0A4Q9PD03_9APHY|nr:hypothetical protein BD310DRAFT_1010823 [Dichomitus squalens]
MECSVEFCYGVWEALSAPMSTEQTHRARKYFAIVPPFFFPQTLFYDAPFGRSSSSMNIEEHLHSIHSWIALKLVAQVAFSGNSYLRSPHPDLYTSSHLMAAVSAVFFNTINGSLMGHVPLLAAHTVLPSRRQAEALKQEHYAIPHGLLYRFILYPRYFCEWVEWLAFALAASPVPSFALVGAFIATVSLPWLFFNEVWLVLPWAYKGHKWYHSEFPDYLKERRVIIPFLF